MDRPLTTFARLLLFGAGGLAVVAGPILFLWPQGTDTYFAWHIQHILTPVFMGANYLAGIGNYIALKENRWSLARVQMPAIIVFALVMLITTLLHIPIFKWNHPIAWAWLAVYVASPPAALAVFLSYERTYRPAESIGTTLPSFTRPLAYAIGFADLLVGLALFFLPAQAGPLWPWTLTPLTARVISGWMLGSTALLWMAGRQRTFSTIYVALLANIVINTALLLGSLWRGSSFDGPTLSHVLFLLRSLLVLAWAITTWLLATRRPS
jgi:hypothetical protein